MKRREMAWLLVGLLGGVLVCAAADVDTRDRTIFQLQHRAWTGREGAPSRIYDLAQTSDGWLWLATASGLYRFDGVQFDRYELYPAEEPGSEYVSSLGATPDGGLWIGLRFGGACFLKDGRVTHYGEREGLPPRSTVYNISVDRTGTIWAATGRGLFRFAGSRWQGVGKDWRYAWKSARTTYVDREGTLWVGTEEGIAFLPQGERVFQRAADRVGRVYQMAQAPDGTMWMTVAGFTRPIPLAAKKRDQPTPSIKAGGGAILFDHAGSLWVASQDVGVLRVRFPDRLKNDHDVERFGEADGLTGQSGFRLLEDREGNVWVASADGLDRFHATNLIPIMSQGRTSTLAGGEQGGDWTGLLCRSGGECLIHTPERAPFPYRFESPATAVYRGANGDVWIGVLEGRAMFRFANGHMVAVPLPGEMVTGFDIQAFTEDHAGNLWVSVVRNGVFRWRDGVWTPYGNLPDLPRDTVLALMTDSRGRVWFSYPGSTGIAVVDGSTVQRFSSQEVQVIDAFGLYERAGHIWIGGERGLALFDGSQFRALAADGRTFSGITGIVETADGDLWLSGAPGIIHVPAEQARRAVENRDYHARCEILDVLDGLRGTAVQLRPVPTAVETSDGRLWFTTTKTLSQIDPAHLLRNGTPPPVYIRAIDSVGKEYAPSSNVKLPLGTRSVNITYTALSYWVPQRVRFRYQLEGVDKVWQDAGARREASYSNLGPGSYHFRVIACNNDGVWNDAGASLDFSIAPAFYQATWFSVSCFILIIVAVAASYRLRVRQITEAMNSRFDDRLAERTRIARDFHDTLLQTIQGSKMVADDALNKPADPIQMRRAMESVSRWLMQAMQEGRSALQSLRSSTTERDDLAGALRRAGDECRFQGSIEFDLYVDGACREMHPIVRDEVYRIGYEAVRNACIHSGGSRVEVKLGYVENLVLRVRDNGKGMDPQATEPGKSDRFGLTGMRERASRIGGRFSLLSSPGAGTTVELVVPRKIAFQRAKRIGRFEAFLRRI